MEREGRGRARCQILREGNVLRLKRQQQFYWRLLYLPHMYKLLIECIAGCTFVRTSVMLHQIIILTLGFIEQKWVHFLYNVLCVVTWRSPLYGKTTPYYTHAWRRLLLTRSFAFSLGTFTYFWTRTDAIFVSAVHYNDPQARCVHCFNPHIRGWADEIKMWKSKNVHVHMPIGIFTISLLAVAQRSHWIYVQI